MNKKFKLNLLSATITMFLVSVTNTNINAKVLANKTSELNDLEEKTLDLGTTTVTARRREEVLQKVPLSVTSIPMDEADSQTTSSDEVANLARDSANLILTEAGGTYSNTFLIRGVGSLKPMASDDSALSVYEDGVPKSIISNPITLFDAKRIEVLRGPQGTLFGRNSLGGAIQVVHNTPKFSDSLNVGSSLGNLNQKNIFIIANKELTDNLAGRVAVRHGEHDGTIENLITGNKNGKKNINNLRASLLGFINDTEINASAWYNRKKDDSPRFIMRENSRFPQVAVNPNNVVMWRDYGASAEITHTWQDKKITSLTSFENSLATQDFDITDGLIFTRITPIPASVFNAPHADSSIMNHKEKRWQQEIRLSSYDNTQRTLSDNSKKNWQWLIGSNIFYSQFENDTTSKGTFKRYAWLNGRQLNTIDTLSTAIFGDLDVPITKKLRANAGVRLTNERKEAHYKFYGNGHPAVVDKFSDEGKINNTLVTGRVGISADISPQASPVQTLLYGNIAYGTASAGYPLFSMTLANAKAVAPYPETNNLSYEAGVKWQSGDHKTTVNGSGFYNDVKNGRLLVFDGKAGRLTPISEDYHSYGAELETQAEILPKLAINANIAYTHARLKNVADNKTPSSSGAKNNNRLADVPEVSGSLALAYQQDSGVYGDVSWQYVGKRSADLKNSFDLDPYSLVHAKLGYAFDKQKIYLYARNLTDEKAQVSGQSWSPKVTSVRLGEPRLFGVGIEAQW